MKGTIKSNMLNLHSIISILNKLGIISTFLTTGCYNVKPFFNLIINIINTAISWMFLPAAIYRFPHPWWLAFTYTWHRSYFNYRFCMYFLWTAEYRTRNYECRSVPFVILRFLVRSSFANATPRQVSDIQCFWAITRTPGNTPGVKCVQEPALRVRENKAGRKYDFLRVHQVI